MKIRLDLHDDGSGSDLLTIAVEHDHDQDIRLLIESEVGDIDVQNDAAHGYYVRTLTPAEARALAAMLITAADIHPET